MNRGKSNCLARQKYWREHHGKDEDRKTGIAREGIQNRGWDQPRSLAGSGSSGRQGRIVKDGDEGFGNGVGAAMEYS